MAPSELFGGGARTVAPGEIVLGLQGTVDYEIAWDGAVVDALVEEHAISADEIDPDIRIVDERTLLISVLAFLATGEGGERHAESSDIVEAFAARFPKEITLGGTCVRAGLALREVGIPSLLHLVSTDANVRRLLPDDCEVITSATHDTLDPHLIIQFRPGDAARVGGREYVVREANRLIVADDPPAENLVLSAELADRVRRSRVFLVSGFNTIADPGILRARLDEVREIAAGAPDDGMVVYEDAGFHDREHQPAVAAAIGPVVDVFSLNEDELQSRLGRRIDLRSAADVAGAMRELRVLVPDPTLVVHTRYWTLVWATPRHAGELERVARAADVGNATAAGRYAHGDRITAERIDAIARGPRQEGSLPFARALEAELGDLCRCHAGFLVDSPAPTTIGLGDTFIGGLIGSLATAPSPIRS
ncbi:ADP-dependent glucokinase/phosphofructokinase [Microbacterium halophytorum]|uniref:ADP-dependent glucokinase/phosphofructokinase n=1 Tax=Microbacterium halophytorum TaxID=2067568 RepID=UPI000CFDFB8B|nr:ADP-dependent glucokinase/phosphofructokinase [Microbacterium halophytorum]